MAVTAGKPVKKLGESQVDDNNPDTKSAMSDSTPSTETLASYLLNGEPFLDRLRDMWKYADANCRAYARLQHMCDTFGHRLNGSAALEQAIDWLLNEMSCDRLENVRADPVEIPHWERGSEACVLLSPGASGTEPRPLSMLGLGNSVPTPSSGIEAEILVVRSFEELSVRAAEGKASGKIIVFNPQWTNYGHNASFRMGGADAAAKVGGLAALVKSPASYSLDTPHTGVQFYSGSCEKIPVACLSTEASELLARLYTKHVDGEGPAPRVRLTMRGKTHGKAQSRNVLAEFVGREKPEEIVVVGGHSDSWDVGQGALDNAQGCVVAWEALRLLKELGFRPRRTIRVVCWVDEENESSGANQYVQQHEYEICNHVAAIETDLGVYTAEGFGFTGSSAARSMLQTILRCLFQDLQATQVKGDGDGVDIEPLIERGIPGLLLKLKDEWWNDKYFHYHHTAADTMDKIDKNHLLQNVKVIAGIIYVLAEMRYTLPI